MAYKILRLPSVKEWDLYTLQHQSQNHEFWLKELANLLE